MCSDQLLASNIHNNFNLRNKFIKINRSQSSSSSFLPAHENFALPYNSPYLAHNLLSDRLWTPLLYMVIVVPPLQVRK